METREGIAPALCSLPPARYLCQPCRYHARDEDTPYIATPSHHGSEGPLIYLCPVWPSANLSSGKLRSSSGRSRKHSDVGEEASLCESQCPPGGGGPRWREVLEKSHSRPQRVASLKHKWAPGAQLRVGKVGWAPLDKAPAWPPALGLGSLSQTHIFPLLTCPPSSSSRPRPGSCCPGQLAACFPGRW